MNFDLLPQCRYLIGIQMNELKLAELERKYGKRRAMRMMQEFLEKEFGMSPAFYTADQSRVGRIENTLGALQLPLGVVGPVNIRGEFETECYLPMVTTESCLVASCQRGAKWFFEADGIAVEVKNLGITRASVLKCASAAGARSVAKFLEENLEKLKELAESTSAHLHIKEIEIKMDEAYLHIKLTADTEEAMGMNMITIAMKKILTEFILSKVPLAVTLIAESSNYCSDKKPSTVVAEHGRGRYVRALGYIPGWLLKRLGVSVADLQELVKAKFGSGSKLAGSIGVNAHHANMVAAFYAATGKDLAHTVEGSLGITKIEPERDGVFVTVELPAVLVGTIGGGTKLPQIQELYKMMRIKPGVENSANELAARLGALVLCGETSLLIALAKAELADSHERLRS